MLPNYRDIMFGGSAKQPSDGPPEPTQLNVSQTQTMHTPQQFSNDFNAKSFGRPLPMTQTQINPSPRPQSYGV